MDAKKTTVVALLLVAMTTGCASHGTAWQFRDILPGAAHSAPEWDGVLASGAIEGPPGEWCFTTKKGDMSPGVVRACSENPEIVSQMRTMRFNGEAGATPTRVRFRYALSGGDQELSIGGKARDQALTAIQGLTLEAGELLDCRMVAEKLGGLFVEISDSADAMTPRNHHGDIAGSANLGKEVITEYFSLYPDSVAGPEKQDGGLDELSRTILAMPPNGHLEIIGKLHWNNNK